MIESACVLEHTERPEHRTAAKKRSAPGAERGHSLPVSGHDPPVDPAFGFPQLRHTGACVEVKPPRRFLTWTACKAGLPHQLSSHRLFEPKCWRCHLSLLKLIWLVSPMITTC